METNNKPSKGFKAAWNGLTETLIKENSFKIMVFVSFLVVAAMFYFHITKSEKIALLLMIFAVLGLELINSTIERILNIISPSHDERVRIIKDLMASIVLVASVGAIIIGLIIFKPYLIK